MVDNFPGGTVADYMVMAQDIAAGTRAAHRELPMEIALLVDGEALLRVVRWTHHLIFENAFGPAAGRYRQAGESVEVGHEGHRFEGAPGEQVEARLRTLGDELPPAHAPTDVDRFAMWAAMFIREFFEIHPFKDGNGRTARAIVELTAAHHGHVVTWPEHTRGQKTKDRNEYLQALQYAHACLGLTAAGRTLRGMSGTRNPYRPLARWWRLRVRAPEELDLDEEDYLATAASEEISMLDDLLEALERQRLAAEAFHRWLEEDRVRGLRLPRSRGGA